MSDRSKKIAITSTGIFISGFAWWAGCIDCAVLMVTGIFIIDVLVKQRKRIK